MSHWLVSRFKLPEIQLLVLISVLLLVINLTGDHVFNKVNNLKVLLVALCAIPLSLYTIIVIKAFNFRVLTLLLLPILALLPGAVLSDFQFSYGLIFELTSQVLCVIWAFLLFSIIQIQKRADRWRVLWVVIPTIYFVCLVAFLEKLGWSPLINIPLNPFEASTLVAPWQYQGIAGRVESTFGNINYFASFLIQLLPLAIALFLITRIRSKAGDSYDRFLGLVALLAGVFILLSLVFTETRSAIFGSMVSLALFVVLLTRIGVLPKVLVLKFGLLAVISFVIVVLIKLDLDSDRFLLLLNKEAWWSRVVAWQAAWNSFKSAPFFGHGLGASYQLFFDYISPDSRLFSDSRSYNHVHNEILQVLQEGGVFGLAVYLCFWGIPLYLGVKFVLSAEAPIELRIMISAIISGLLAYHIHGLFSVAPRMISSRLIAYSLWAILLAVVYKPTLHGALSKWGKYHRAVLAIILLSSVLSILTYLVSFLQGQYHYAKVITQIDRKAQLMSLANNYNDIYILEAAAKEVFEAKETEPLLAITRKAAVVFPHYREMDVYQAYAHYWQGDVEAAYLIAADYQIRDRYNTLVNTLLLAIAIERSSESDFVAQLSNTIHYQACHNHLMACDVLDINIVSGSFALPFQIVDKGDKWNVLLEKSFSRALKELKADTSGDRDRQPEVRALVLKLLSRGNFFKPEGKISQPLTELDYSRLTLYLEYRNQNIKPDDQQLMRENRLENTINLTRFLQKRALLIGLSSTLFSAIK
ncbi:MAG: O-antigen ligase [Oleispira sp.]|jgi:O-antigen ligase